MRSRNFVWNFLSGIGLSGTTLLAGFVATPYLIQWLGEERLGAFRALQDWTAYLMILELGYYSSLQALFADAIGSNDRELERATAILGIRRYAIVALMACGLGVCAMPMISYAIPVAADTVDDLRYGLLLSLFAYTLLPAIVARAGCEAAQQTYVVHGAMGIQSLLTIGCSVYFAFLGWGIFGQALAQIPGLAAFYLSLWTFNLRRNPRFIAGFWHFRIPKQVTDRFARLNPPLFVGHLCGRLNFFTDNIMVTWTLGPAAVLPFFLTLKLPLVAGGQLGNIGNSGWAGLSELHTRGETATLHRRLCELTKIILIFGFAVLAPIFAFNTYFIRFWVGEKFFVSDVFTALACLNALMLGVFALWNWLFVGTGRMRHLIPGIIAETLINLTTSIILLLRVGLLGPVLGTAIGFFCVQVWWLPLNLKKVFRVSPVDLAKSMVPTAVVGFGFSWVLWILSRKYPPDGWMDLGIEMVAAAVAFLGLSYCFLLSKDERQLWRYRLRQIFLKTL